MLMPSAAIVGPDEWSSSTYLPNQVSPDCSVKLALIGAETSNEGFYRALTEVMWDCEALNKGDVLVFAVSSREPVQQGSSSSIRQAEYIRFPSFPRRLRAFISRLRENSRELVFLFDNMSKPEDDFCDTPPLFAQDLLVPDKKQPLTSLIGDIDSICPSAEKYIMTEPEKLSANMLEQESNVISELVVYKIISLLFDTDTWTRSPQAHVFAKNVFDDITVSHLEFLPTVKDVIATADSSRGFTPYFGHTCCVWNTMVEYNLLNERAVGLIQQYRQLCDIIEIHKQTLSHYNLPIELKFPTYDKNFTDPQYDFAVSRLAAFIGSDSAIEAYLSGVPIEDILI